MRKKTIFGNIGVAVGAQLIALIASLFASLISPKVLSFENFGYWQLFLFYCSYAGLLHFGLNDGVYLLNGGRIRRTLDSAAIRSQFYIGAVLQVAVLTTIQLAAYFFIDDHDRRFVLQAFSVFALLYNLSAFLGYLLQAINEPRRYSGSVALSKLSFLIIIAVPLLIGIDSILWLTAGFITGQAIALVYCIYECRDILFGQILPIKSGLQEAFASARTGFGLMLANLANLLIIGVARFVIDFRWTIEDFGKLSLMLSVTSFALLFLSQVSMVLFPALRQLTREKQVDAFVKIRASLSVLGPLLLLLYLPAHFFIVAWLPEYSDSLIYLTILFPVVIFNMSMDIGFTTFYKVFRFERSLLALNLLSLAISTLLSVVSAFVLDTMYLTVAGIVAVVAARYLLADLVLHKQLGLNRDFHPWFSILSSALFLTVFLTLEVWSAAAIYLSYCVLFATINRSSMNALFKAVFA